MDNCTCGGYLHGCSSKVFTQLDISKEPKETNRMNSATNLTERCFLFVFLSCFDLPSKPYFNTQRPSFCLLILYPVRLDVIKSFAVNGCLNPRKTAETGRKKVHKTSYQLPVTI